MAFCETEEEGQGYSQGLCTSFISQEPLKVTRPRSVLAKPSCLPSQLSAQLETSAAGTVGAVEMPGAICC